MKSLKVELCNMLANRDDPYSSSLSDEDVEQIVKTVYAFRRHVNRPKGFGANAFSSIAPSGFKPKRLVADIAGPWVNRLRNAHTVTITIRSDKTTKKYEVKGLALRGFKSFFAAALTPGPNRTTEIARMVDDIGFPPRAS